MRRRALLRKALLVSTLAAAPWVDAQVLGRPARVAILGVTSPETGGIVVDAVIDQLRILGWVENRNVTYEFRWARGDLSRLPEFARELVAWKPDVIWTTFTVAALAVRQATSTIPIVLGSVADPVGSGLVASFASPGGLTR